VNTNLRAQLLEKFRDKEYRDAFVQEFIFSRIPLKIRAIRDKRGMSQAELGEKAQVAQAWVSKLEDPNYGRLTLSTLLKIASAFDCGLFVDFVPFSRILNEATIMSPQSFDVPAFDDDSALVREPSVPVPVSIQNPAPTQALLTFVGHTRATTTLGEFLAVQPTVGPTKISSRYGNSFVYYNTSALTLSEVAQQSLAPVSMRLPNQEEGGLANEALGGSLS